MTKKKSYDLGGIEVEEIIQIGQFNFKVIQSMRIDREMKDTIIAEKLRQSLKDQASLLCGGVQNIESHSHQFNDFIHMSHGMTERELKKSNFKTGYSRNIAGYIRCHDKSIYHVSTTKISDNQFQTTKEMTVFSHIFYIEDYKPTLANAVIEEAKKQCIGGNKNINVTNEFSVISSSTFHSDEAETHIIKVIGDITCQ